MNKLNSMYILAFLWILWCTLHSLLISRAFSAWMKRIWGSRFAYYRLFFNTFSLVTLIPVVIYQHRIPEEIIFNWGGPWVLLKSAMYLSSFVLFYGGYQVFDMQYMLGIKQVHELQEGKKEEDVDFSTSGVLEYVRHPWYSGAILFVWAFGAISDVLLVTKLILTTYIIIGAFLEERKMILEIGEPYHDYRKRVPMLIPWRKKEQR